jgi:acyl-CoA synthetase (AMP-forming)/AMP-acid ligase II
MNSAGMNLAAAFVKSARSHASKTAVFWGEEELSYDWLRSRAVSVAERLTREFRIQPGDRVALW